MAWNLYRLTPQTPVLTVLDKVLTENFRRHRTQAASPTSRNDTSNFWSPKLPISNHNFRHIGRQERLKMVRCVVLHCYSPCYFANATECAFNEWWMNFSGCIGCQRLTLTRRRITPPKMRMLIMRPQEKTKVKHRYGKYIWSHTAWFYTDNVGLIRMQMKLRHRATMKIPVVKNKLAMP